MALVETSRNSPLPPLAVNDTEDETEEEGLGEEGELEEPLDEPHAEESAAEVKKRLLDWVENDNIARDIPAEQLSRLGQIVVREYEIDEQSRSEWKDIAEHALDLAAQKAKPKEYPWPEACLSLDTDILTRTGWRPIAEVQVGEEVLSRAADGTAGYYPVLKTFRYRAREVVHFEGKSIDLLATPNHNMLVEDRVGGAGTRFVPAGEFVKNYPKGKRWPALSWTSIPLTSRIDGERPETIYGIPAFAYVRFLGWYISEGWAGKVRANKHRLKSGIEVDYGPAWSSFGIAQSKEANPKKCLQIEQDIEACGFTWRRGENQTGYTVHGRSMPRMFKEELRSMAGCRNKRIPRHVFALAPEYLEALLETMMAGDGHMRKRAHQRQSHGVYFTTSQQLADDVQELCQRIGLRATITQRAATMGGAINGRPIRGVAEGYSVSINRKPNVQVLKLKRQLEPYDADVACVEVAPHHTIYVRRNGKPVWVGNSNVIFPLITTASLQFQARAYPAIIQNRSVVKGVVWGDDKGIPVTIDGKPDSAPKIQSDGTPLWLIPPGEKKRRASKVGEHMSWQLLEQMEEWEPQTDQMLGELPIVGGAVRKTIRDTRENKNSSLRVSLLDLVWNYRAPSFEKAPRHTEIQEWYPHEIEEFERDNESFLPLVYGVGDSSADPNDTSGDSPAADPNDSEAPHVFLEQHRRYDLDGDGYPEPLIVTVHKSSARVVRIVARYDEDGLKFDEKTGELKRIEPIQSYTLYRFLTDPKGGSYPVGFGHILKGLNEAANSTLNQMFDAGHLQIAGGGFIGQGLSMHGGPMNFSIGEYKPVNTRGPNIRDSIYQIQWPGPSTVLFQLLGFLISAAKETASIQEVLTGDAAIANAPPTTVLALIEQGMKVYTAIHKRLFRSLKAELNKLYRLNRIYLTEDERFQIGDMPCVVSPDDYRLAGGVEPVADPTMVTDMQRLGRAMVVSGEAKDNPLVNRLEATRRIFEAAQIDRIGDLIPDKMPPPQPTPEQHEMQMREIELQSTIGQKRALELMQYTQAILNFQKARATMTGPQLQWVDKQLELMRLHVEALNTTVKAAQADAAVHRNRVAQYGHELAHHGHMVDVAQRGRELAREEVNANGPADAGGGGAEAPGNEQPGGPGPVGGGVPAVAPPAGQSGLPAIPGPPEPPAPV